MDLHSFWWWMTLACVVWYTLVTAYVGFKGAFNIRDMLARLKEQP